MITNVDTPLGTLTTKLAVAADLPALTAIAKATGARSSTDDLALLVAGKGVEAVRDARGDVRGYLIPRHSDDGGTWVECVAARGSQALVGPILVASAMNLAAQGRSPIRVMAPHATPEMLPILAAAGFQADTEFEDDGHVVLRTTKRRLAYAVAASPVPSRHVSLADADDDELAAEVRRRRTMVASIWTLADVRGELGEEGAGLDDVGLEAAARRFVELTGPLFEHVLDKAGAGYVVETWKNTGEYIRGELGLDGPKP